MDGAEEELIVVSDAALDALTDEEGGGDDVWEIPPDGAMVVRVAAVLLDASGVRRDARVEAERIFEAERRSPAFVLHLLAFAEDDEGRLLEHAAQHGVERLHSVKAVEVRQLAATLVKVALEVVDVMSAHERRTLRRGLLRLLGTVHVNLQRAAASALSALIRRYGLLSVPELFPFLHDALCAVGELLEKSPSAGDVVAGPVALASMLWEDAGDVDSATIRALEAGRRARARGLPAGASERDASPLQVRGVRRALAMPEAPWPAVRVASWVGDAEGGGGGGGGGGVGGGIGEGEEEDEMEEVLVRDLRSDASGWGQAVAGPGARRPCGPAVEALGTLAGPLVRILEQGHGGGLGPWGSRCALQVAEQVVTTRPWSARESQEAVVRAVLPWLRAERAPAGASSAARRVLSVATSTNFSLVRARLPDLLEDACGVLSRGSASAADALAAADFAGVALRELVRDAQRAEAEADDAEAQRGRHGAVARAESGERRAEAARLACAALPMLVDRCRWSADELAELGLPTEPVADAALPDPEDALDPGADPFRRGGDQDGGLGDESGGNGGSGGGRGGSDGMGEGRGGSDGMGGGSDGRSGSGSSGREREMRWDLSGPWGPAMEPGTDAWTARWAAARAVEHVARLQAPEVARALLETTSVRLGADAPPLWEDEPAWLQQEAALLALGAGADAVAASEAHVEGGGVEEVLSAVAEHGRSHEQPLVRAAAAWCLGRFTSFLVLAAAQHAQRLAEKDAAKEEEGGEDARGDARGDERGGDSVAPAVEFVLERLFAIAGDECKLVQREGMRALRRVFGSTGAASAGAMPAFARRAGSALAGLPARSAQALLGAIHAAMSAGGPAMGLAEDGGEGEDGAPESVADCLLPGLLGLWDRFVHSSGGGVGGGVGAPRATHPMLLPLLRTLQSVARACAGVRRPLRDGPTSHASSALATFVPAVAARCLAVLDREADARLRDAAGRAETEPDLLAEAEAAAEAWLCLEALCDAGAHAFSAAAALRMLDRSRRMRDLGHGGHSDRGDRGDHGDHTDHSHHSDHSDHADFADFGLSSCAVVAQSVGRVAAADAEACARAGELLLRADVLPWVVETLRSDIPAPSDVRAGALLCLRRLVAVAPEACMRELCASSAGGAHEGDGRGEDGHADDDLSEGGRELVMRVAGALDPAWSRVSYQAAGVALELLLSAPWGSRAGAHIVHCLGGPLLALLQHPSVGYAAAWLATVALARAATLEAHTLLRAVDAPPAEILAVLANAANGAGVHTGLLPSAALEGLFAIPHVLVALRALGDPRVAADAAAPTAARVLLQCFHALNALLHGKGAASDAPEADARLLRGLRVVVRVYFHVLGADAARALFPPYIATFLTGAADIPHTD